MVRILLLTHAFNSLAQRLYVELASRAHDVSVELDVNDAVSEQAIALFEPDVVIAPYLKRAIPASIWRRQTCLVVHPGIIGDRGPAALDWAILEGAKRWGVTVLQADATMDGGDVWASVEFPMRDAHKSNLYRNEVTEAAVEAVLTSIERVRCPHFRPRRLDYSDSRVRGTWRPAMRQDDRAIDWVRDPTETVLRKLWASDGSPGVLDELMDVPVYLFGAIGEDRLRGRPGEILARRDEAICRATVDGAVWISHLKPLRPDDFAIKLPATRVLCGRLDAIPEVPIGLFREPGRRTYQPIAYEQRDGVGYLHFDFYNGAMSTDGCRRLLEAYCVVRGGDARVLVLTGGEDFWSNGIDLNCIEAHEHPADESWRNINAMDDLCREIIITDDKLVVAAMGANAGAGGVFLGLAADRVIVREGVVLNPHYKNIGNLYGSEYWTYLLPRRVGDASARKIIARRLPMGAREARYVGLVDELLPGSPQAFLARVHERALRIAVAPEHRRLVAAKRTRRQRDEQLKALACYRAEELERMKLNFYGFDPSYHVARYNFVHKRPQSWTPLHLATHRRRRKRADVRPASRLKRAESAFLGVLRCDAGDASPTSADPIGHEVRDGGVSGLSVDPPPGAQAADATLTDAASPETNVENAVSGTSGENQSEAFPSSTLRAILGKDGGASPERPPGQAIEYSAAELAHLEHAMRRRARRRVNVEPEVAPLIDARHIAARVAGNLKSPAVLEALSEALVATDLELRRGAADSIARMLERGADCSCVSLKSLLAALSTGQRDLTVSLLKILPHMPAAPARDVLTRLLDDADAAVRAEAIQTLRAMGEDIPQLERRLNDEAPGVRCAAAMALAQRDGRSALAKLVAQCFRHGGVDRAEIAAILRDLDIPAASNAMCEVLSDHQRGGEWQVAIEAIAVLHAAR